LSVLTLAKESDVLHEEAVFRTPAMAFGPYRLYRDPKLLCHGDDTVRLGGRAFDLLVALVERAGEVLSRDELEAQVWPSSVVEDSSLRVHIGALRKALGDGIDGVRYIANVPGRGYSFVAPVWQLGGEARHESAPPPDRALAPSQPGRPVDNLPARLTSVIGRDATVAMLATVLPQRRLATIVGHGGIGKTVLALAVASELRLAYQDGACFVDLAPLSKPSDVPQALASALGLAIGGDDALPVLDAYLKPRRLLLVLDNCEHLLDAAAGLLDRVLKTAPGIDVLATSREPLDADGEWVHRLAPLDSPPADVVLGCADALAFPALQLLVERATASLDSFMLTDANVGVAAALCRRLDGVPLAIEFAAARIGLLGVHGVAAQLDDRLRLLGSGRRTALPRHRTLRALLDWSYELLSEAERRVLRRCSVFKGGFTLESAVAVLADGDMPAGQVRDCVLSLVTKSLVNAELGLGVPYYTLFEVTRAYAIEKLDSDSRQERLLVRHAHHMLALLDQGQQDWPCTARAQWLLTCLRSVGNLSVALDWAFAGGGEPSLGVALTAAIALPAVQFLREDELRSRAGQALAAIEHGAAVEPRHELRIRGVLAHGGRVACAAGAPLHGCADDAAGDADRHDCQEQQVETLYQMGARCFGAGDYRAAGAYAERARLVAHHADDPASIVHSERMSCQAAHFLGYHGPARRLAERVLEQAGDKLPLRFGGSVDRRVSMRIVLARILWLTGYGEQAAALAAECIDLAAADEQPTSLAHALCLAACPIAFWRGDDAHARSLVERLDAHAQCHSLAYWESWAGHYRQVLALRGAGEAPGGIAAPADAKQIDHLATFTERMYVPAALERAKQGTVGWCMPEVLRVHGEQLQRQGGMGADARAESMFIHSLEAARQQQALAWALRSASSLARLWLEQGRARDARQLLEPVYGQFGEGFGSTDLRTANRLLALAS
jgi:predicted ATPase/DNA-binding winged helix-turn-helix (wHTH) protein